jgi:Zn-dependent protease/CBS domain-containing protein
VSGIDILVQQSWFLIVLLIAIVMQPRVDEVAPGLGGWSYVAAAAFAVLLYFSVLLHEISHAVAARTFQMPVSSINLHFLGGFTEIEAEAATPWREFVIAVVGPLTSLALGGACYLAFLTFDEGLAGLIIGALAGANILVGGLNLVPGLPLDGGRVLQSAVWAVSSRRSLGLRVAAWAGRVAAILAACYPLILLSLDYQPQLVDYALAFMIGAFMWSGASQALLSATVHERLPRLQARRLARPAIGVPADLPLAEAIRRAQEANAGSLVIVSSGGEPEGIVNEAAVASTPLDRRPWMSTGSLARRIEAGLMLPADLQGEDLLRAMQTTPATEYVLVEPTGSVYGVLVTKDVDNAFRSG